MRKHALLVLGLSFILTSVLAQKLVVTGKVLDEKGVSIPGASVKEKGTKAGVSADNYGLFRFTVKPGSTLVVSAAGFLTKEVIATANLNVELAVDVKNLSEVIVTAQGIRRRPRELGYSATSVNNADINVGHSAQLATGLAG